MVRRPTRPRAMKIHTRAFYWGLCTQHPPTKSKTKHQTRSSHLQSPNSFFGRFFPLIFFFFIGGSAALYFSYSRFTSCGERERVCVVPSSCHHPPSCAASYSTLHSTTIACFPPISPPHSFLDLSRRVHPIPCLSF